MSGAEKVISVAKDEVGYLEKKSDKDLDSKTANSGNGNYTKYARDLCGLVLCESLWAGGGPSDGGRRFQRLHSHISPVLQG